MTTPQKSILLFLFVVAAVLFLHDPGFGAVPDIKKDCSLCHPEDNAQKGKGILNKPVSELCIACHPDRKAPAEHKVDVLPSMPVAGLPLSAGKMTCVTCHDPHSDTYQPMLRLAAKNLCVLCHKL